MTERAFKTKRVATPALSGSTGAGSGNGPVRALIGAGLIGPTLAIAFATLFVVLVLQQYGGSRMDDASAWRARVVAQTTVKDLKAGVRRAPMSPLVLRVVEDRADVLAFAFSRSLSFTAHPTRAGQALDPARDDDTAAADGHAAGLNAATDFATATGHRAVAPAGPRQVVIVDAPRIAQPPLPWVLICLAGLLAWIVWLGALRLMGTTRWTSAVAALAAASIILGVLFWGLGAIEDAINQANLLVAYTGAHPPIEPASTAFAIPLLPLVIAGIAGWFSRGRRSRHRVAYMYIAPAIAGMAVLILVPFALGVALAFTRHHQGHFTFVGLANFIDILSSADVPITAPLSVYFTLVVTVFWTALNVALHASIGLGLALFLREPTLRLKAVYRVLLIVPWAVPNYITALIWKGMFNKQYGLINETLSLVGVEPIGWFSGFWTAFMANVTTNTWLGFPFMMVVCLGALQSIPRDMYEAASVDGAGRWDQFKHITLPLLKPALFPALILGSIWTFNMFNIIYLVSGGAPNGSTDILITEAYRWAFEQDRHGYASAYSVLIFLILLGYSLITARISKGVEETYE